MSGSTSDSSVRRRSSRLEMHLKVRVSGLNADSQEFDERTETIEVSKYGAKIYTQHTLKTGAVLSLERPDADRLSKFKVVYQGPTDDATGRRETGIEFVGADSFWGLQFPPEKGLRG
jgi:hypothetical protein